MKGSVPSIVLIGLVLLLVSKAWGYTEEMCIQCHREGSAESGLHIPLRKYLSSLHGLKIRCLDCHEDVRSDAHFAENEVNPVDCQKCHEQKNLHAPDKSVSCQSCHPPHQTYSMRETRSAIYWRNLGSNCGKCHPTQSGETNIFERLIFWKISTHPKEDFARMVDRTMCVGCHQGKAAHGEDTPVNGQDCYKCHDSSRKSNSRLGFFHIVHVRANSKTNSLIIWMNLIGFGCIILISLNLFRNNRDR